MESGSSGGAAAALPESGSENFFLHPCKRDLNFTLFGGSYPQVSARAAPIADLDENTEIVV